MDIDMNDRADIIDRAPESKAGIAGSDALVTQDEMMRVYEHFRQANDERIAAIERRSADPLLEDKVERINTDLTRRLDELTLKNARPALERNDRAVLDLAARAQERVRRLPAHRRERRPARARSEGDVGRLQSRRRLCGAGRDRAGDRRAAHRDLADPLDRRSAHDQRQRLQEAVHDRGPRGRLGRRDRRAAADHVADARSALVSGDGALRHAGGDRDACSKMPRSISTSGSPPRSSRRSRCRKAPPSSPATARTSRRAFSPTPRSRMPPGCGATSATSRPARPARSRRAIRPTSLVDLIYALKAGYRQNAAFVMNRKTQAAIRKFKDAQGDYLWQPPAQAGGRAVADDLPGGRGRGHARHRRELALGRVRRFRPRLSGGRPRRA